MNLNYVSKNIILDNHNNRFINESFFWNNIKNKNFNISGSFACIKKTSDGYYLARDPSGSKKIFYGITIKKKIKISNNFIDLIVKKKVIANSIKSVEKGSIIKLNNAGEINWQKYFKVESNSQRNYQRYIKQNIILFLKELKKKHGDNCVVCLSGGLDSTIIAYHASKVFRKLNLINISIEYKNKINQEDYLDFNAAIKIAKYLKCKLIKLKIRPSEICLKNLKKIMYASQDYRDYNVHCATLNYFIAKKIKKGSFVITGDFMNEYFADYKEEIFNNRKYYLNPKVNQKHLQNFFMRSLDSSDREIGVFNYFNIPLYQPYSIFFNFFKNLDVNKLRLDNIKFRMNSKLIPSNLSKFVLKDKVRAQVGDKKGGILGCFVKKKLTSNFLKSYFIREFSLQKKWLKNFFNIGSYRI